MRDILRYGVPYSTLEVYSKTISATGEYTHAQLNAGVEIYIPSINDIIVDIAVDVTTAFNTTAKADIGTFVDTNTGICKASRYDDVIYLEYAGTSIGGTGVKYRAGQNSNHGISNIAAAIGYGVDKDPHSGTFLITTATNPIKIAISQTGLANDTPITSTTGSLTVYTYVIKNKNINKR